MIFLKIIYVLFILSRLFRECLTLGFVFETMSMKVGCGKNYPAQNSVFYTICTTKFKSSLEFLLDFGTMHLASALV